MRWSDEDGILKDAEKIRDAQLASQIIFPHEAQCLGDCQTKLTIMQLLPTYLQLCYMKCSEELYLGPSCRHTIECSAKEGNLHYNTC